MADTTGIPSQLLQAATALAAPGFSSTSPTGEGAAAAMGAGTGKDSSKLRSQADSLLKMAGNSLTDASSQPDPPAPAAPMSPLETALGLVIGGALNRESRFTDEGTRALAAFMNQRQQLQDAAYQQQVNAHRTAIQSAQDGYRLAMQQADPLYTQANQIDSQTATTDRFNQQQQFESQQQAERIAAQKAEDELRESHQQAATADDQQFATGQAKQQFDQKMQELMANVLTKTGAGRSLLAGQIGTSLGWDPDKVREYARVMALQTPDEAMRQVRTRLQKERLPPP